MDPAFIDWLMMGALGPAMVALPVNWTASQLGSAARRWVARLRRTDGLSRLAQADAPIKLSRGEVATLRQFLENPQTWQLLSNGTVEDLAGKIAACLPQGKGDAARDPLSAARAIARGLVEFAVADLEPELFQRLLLARLTRLEKGQAAALDEAMLRLDADLVVRFAQQSHDDEQGFRRVMTQLGKVLDRLPAGSAGPEEVALYLAELIRWMSSDPWPRDPRLRGPVLTPAAIERKLMLEGGADWKRDLDADELARWCTRLVVLGGAGSGKTWLARRIARRCAEAALEALTAGSSLDEIELPLFTTCSVLASATGSIRQAAVSSALDQLGDLGGFRITEALRQLFIERNAPTLLVIDSLDEARSPDARLRQADTLPWRIVVTSRPSSWKEQIDLDKRDESHRLGSLQPLRYPNDVRAFIGRWFEQQPAWAEGLYGQIASRPDLQQAATVPLILAFYCIIGGDQALPATRRELYALVVRRILAGLWRDSVTERPDPAGCSAILGDWAWAGATRDQHSGIGTWADEISTPHAHMSQPDRAAVDHVATPLSLEDFDTETTLRRFIHRSVREHLTAEHIATRMTAAQAAAELLNHIWYDPDWEYAAPAALVMHPDRDEILKRLISQASRSEQVPDGLASIDGCRELRRFLARVAQESSEADWSGDCTMIISRARLDLAADGLFGDLRRAPGWPGSDHLLRGMLLARLTPEAAPGPAKLVLETLARFDPAAGDRQVAERAVMGLVGRQADPRKALDLAEALAGLGPGERKQAGQALLSLLAREVDPWRARDLAWSLCRLQPTDGELKQARQALLSLLTRSTGVQGAGVLAEALARLRPGPAEREQAAAALLAMIARQTNPAMVWGLALALADLGPDQREQAGQALLALLDRQADPLKAKRMVQALSALKPGPAERQQAGALLVILLTRETDAEFAGMLAEALASLRPGPRQREQAGQALLALLDRPVDSRGAWNLAKALAALGPGERERAREALLAVLARSDDPWKARNLGQALATLEPTLGEREQAGQVLLALLGRQGDPLKALAVVEGLARLVPGPAEREQARQRLLALLARETDTKFAVMLVTSLVKLEPESAERNQARQLLLALVSSKASASEARSLAQSLAELGPGSPGEEEAQPQQAAHDAGQALLDRLARETEPRNARDLAEALTRLDPGPAEREQARQQLLGLLACETDTKFAVMLVTSLAGLSPGRDEREQAGQALLALLASETDARLVRLLAEQLTRLGLAERDEAIRALLSLLGRQVDPWKARDLVEALAALKPGPAEREHARQSLLGLLFRESDPQLCSPLVDGLARLEPGPAEREQAWQALLALLARESSKPRALTLLQALAKLQPDARVLTGWPSWAIPPSKDLLAAARRNTTLSSWLDVLAALSGLPA